MGKLISWVAVILLLGVVPIGSWVYLNKGLNYRKAALAELVPKDSINISLDTLKLLSDKTTLIVLRDKDTNEIVEAIKDQFKNAQGFQVLYRDSIGGSNYLPLGYAGGYFIKDDNFSFVLVDTKLKVRNYYKNDIGSVKKMIEHIAIVIPRPKEADIEQKSKI
jgi:hypothetical protein